MREDAVLSLLARDGADRLILDRLIGEDRLRPVRYRGYTFCVRRLPNIDAGEGGSP
jgi:hypothetical protein